MRKNYVKKLREKVMRKCYERKLFSAIITDFKTASVYYDILWKMWIIQLMFVLENENKFGSLQVWLLESKTAHARQYISCSVFI